MWRVALVSLLVVVGCGKSKSKGGSGTGSGSGGSGGSATGKARFDKVKQPQVSAMCAEAREVFGYGAECVETELPELETPAGKVFRLTRKGDPVNSWIYGLLRPDNTVAVGSGGNNGRFLDKLLAGRDLKAIAPEKLAQLWAELKLESAVIRCLPGKSDVLPAGKVYREHACSAPTITERDGKRILDVIVEKFEHPALYNRDDHVIYSYQIEVKDDGTTKELSDLGGDGLIDLPEDGKLPPTAPPLPEMTTAPSWQGEPVEAPADVSAALCAAALQTSSQLKGRQCKAYGYPSLELPRGSLYFLANDAGVRHLHAFKRQDGSIVTGYPLESDQSPMLELEQAYDPAAVPPAKLVAVALFLNGESSSILCLPGSGDKLPDAECKAPSVEKKGAQQIVKAILLERPLPDLNGMTDDPAVRTYSITIGEGEPDMSGGWRLVDMRDQ